MLQPTAPRAPRSSASVLATLQEPRVLYVQPDHTILKPAPVPKVEVPLTVVVTVDDVKRLPDTLCSLIVQAYANFQIIVACMSPKDHDEIARIVGQHQPSLPRTRLFSLKSAGWPADALNGVLPLIETEYWSWLHAADMLHARALATVADAIVTHEADYYSTCRYRMQINLLARAPAIPEAPSDTLLWSGADFPYDRLITYRMSALARIGGFVSYDRYPGDTAWIAAYKMKAADCRFHHIPAAVYFERVSSRPAVAEVSPVEYRRALLLQHWPSFYVEESDEAAINQMLEQIEEVEGRGSQDPSQEHTESR